MSQENESQVLYLGRWVSREHFRAFVYNKEGKKLANTYEEYGQLISSGLWQSVPYVEPEPEIESIQSSNFNDDEIIESEIIVTEPETVVVDIKPKRGRKCRNQLSQ